MSSRFKGAGFNSNSAFSWGTRLEIEYAGAYEDVVGGSRLFDGSIASGSFINCTANDQCFGGGTSGPLVTASCTYTSCIGGSNSFGDASGISDDAKLNACQMSGNEWIGAFPERMLNCRWSATFALGNSARIYGSTFLGSVNLNARAADIARCRIKGALSNAGSASCNINNLVDSDVN